MHWILVSERSDEKQLRIEGLPPIFEELEIDFCEGNVISQNLGVIDFPFSNTLNSIMTDNLAAAPAIGLLINEKVRGIFDKLNIDNIQYFKSRLINEDTKTINEEYYLANIIGKLSCVDRSLSDLDLFDSGNIRFIDKLVLNLDDNTDYGHIFRMADFLPLIVISDELKMALENSKVTGFGIYRPEEYSL